MDDLYIQRSSTNLVPAILNSLTGVGAFIVSYLTQAGMPIGKATGKVLGVVTVYTGMSLVVWAALHLGRIFLGGVTPRSDKIVRDGPYRHVRHPVYLGMAIAFVGVALAFRSWIGLVCVFIMFLPSEIYRARLEERALANKFGIEWEEYASRTGLMLPFKKRGNRNRNKGFRDYKEKSEGGKP
jgi:protein-S-isoprenylcysteine O-methyltransferase Ste14